MIENIKQIGKKKWRKFKPIFRQ